MVLWYVHAQHIATQPITVSKNSTFSKTVLYVPGFVLYENRKVREKCANGAFANSWFTNTNLFFVLLHLFFQINMNEKK